MSNMYEIHIAEVVNNDDEKKQGRIQVKSEALRGEMIYPIWINNLTRHFGEDDGEIYIPKNKSKVYVLIPQSSNHLARHPEDVFWMGMHIANKDIPAPFLINYPDRQGYFCDAGFFIWDRKDKEMLLQHIDGRTIEFPKDKSISISHPSGGSLTFYDQGGVILSNVTGAEIVYSQSSDAITVNTQVFNMLGNIRGVARKDDEVTSDSAADSAFWSFVAAFQASIAAITPAGTEPGLLAWKTAVALLSWPTKQVGKVSTFSDKVFADD